MVLPPVCLFNLVKYRELTGVARVLSLLFILVQAYEAVECLEEEKLDIITNHVQFDVPTLNLKQKQQHKNEHHKSVLQYECSLQAKVQH